MKREDSKKSKEVKPKVNFISAPLIKKNTNKKKTKRRKFKKKPKADRGVVYFSHIPHGFYEEQIKEYCSQFGIVTGLYLPRSKQGKSRGYGFVEFLNTEVAKVVAETMNNYMMHNRLLKAKYVPPSSQRPGIIRRGKTWNNQARATNIRKKTLLRMTKKLSPEEEKNKEKNILKSIRKYHKKLEDMGLNYKFQVDTGAVDEKTSPD